jgi:hypothetical protein
LAFTITMHLIGVFSFPSVLGCRTNGRGSRVSCREAARPAICRLAAIPRKTEAIHGTPGSYLRGAAPQLSRRKRGLTNSPSRVRQHPSGNGPHERPESTGPKWFEQAFRPGHVADTPVKTMPQPVDPAMIAFIDARCSTGLFEVHS